MAVNSVANYSVVMGIRPVTKRSLVQNPLWPLDFMHCALRQGTLSMAVNIDLVINLHVNSTALCESLLLFNSVSCLY